MDIQEHLDTLASDPGNRDAFEKILEHMIAGKQWADIDPFCENTVADVEDEQAREKLLRTMEKLSAQHPEAAALLNVSVGRLYWKVVDHQEKAERSLRKVNYEEVDADAQALLKAFYTAYYIEKNNWRRLEQFFDQITPDTGDDKLELKRELAKIAEETGNEEKAIHFWKLVHAQDESDAESKQALIALFTQSEKWYPLVDIYKGDLAKVPDEDLDTRIAIHKQMIEIYRDRIKSENMVTNTYQAILQIAPGDAEAIDALIAQYEAMKRWPALIEVLQKKATVTADRDELVAVHLQRANLFLDKFSNQTEAIKCFEEILELDGEHLDVIRTLKEIYEKRRDWAKFVDMSAKEIDLSDEGNKAARFEDLALLANDKLRRPQLCMELWQSVLRHEEGNKRALEELDALYERERDYAALGEILEKRLAVSATDDERVELLQRLGQVYGDRLDQTDDAIRIWKALLDIDSEHRRAKEELKKKYLAIRDWEALEEFFTLFGTTDEYIRVLEHQAKILETPAEQIALFAKTAQLYLGELDNIERAIRAYEQILELDGRNNDAALALIPIYEAREEWKKLAGVREIQLANLSEPTDRQPVFLALCGICETHLADRDTTFSYYLRAFSEDPRHDAILENLERLAPTTTRWFDFVNVLETAVEAVKKDKPRLLAYHLRLAQIYHLHLEAYEKSLEHYLWVLKKKPEHGDALDATEALYGALGRWDELLETLRRKLDLSADLEEQKKLRLKSARVYRDNVADLNAAVDLLQEVITDFPSDVDVLDELCLLQMAQDDFGSLVSTLTRKLEVVTAGDDVDDAALSRIKAHLGMLAYGQEHDVAKAIGFYEEALAANPGNEDAIMLLEGLIGAEEQRSRIAMVLEPIYLAAQNWNRLVDILEIQLLSEETPAVRAGLLERIGELHKERREAPNEAYVAYARLFVANAGHPTVREELDALAAIMDRWESLVALYQSVVEGIDDDRLKTSVLLTIAQIHYDQLANRDEAESSYQAVLAIDPVNAEALDNLENLYTMMMPEQGEKLLDIFRRKFEACDDNLMRKEISFKMAALLRDVMEDLGEAIAAVTAVFDFEPEDPDALEYLDHLYYQTEAWIELADILERRIVISANPAARADLQLRLAEVLEHRLDDAPGAIQIFQQVLLDNSEEMRAVDHLERLFGVTEHQPLIAPILEPIYQSRGLSDALITVHRVQIGSADDLDDKVNLLHRIAAIYEDAESNGEAAFATYAEAFELRNDRPETLDHLQRLADILSNYPQLVHLLQTQVERISDPDFAAQLHMLIATLSEERCFDNTTAEHHYLSVLELEPENLQAIDALIRIYQQSENASDLVIYLVKKAELTDDGHQKVALYFQAAELLLVQLNDRERTIEIYQRVLDFDPAHLEAVNALESLYADGQDYPSLVQVYTRKIDLTDDVHQKKEILYRMGAVYNENLQLADEAIDTFRKILDWDEADLLALQALDELYTGKQDWLNLLEVLERLQLLHDGPQQQEVMYRVGRLHELELADVYQAIETYGAVLALNPRHHDTINALEHLVDGSDAKLQAIEVLEPIYRDGGEWEKLLRLYEVLVTASESPLEKIGVLHRIGEICSQNLLDYNRAFHAYSRSFQTDPNDESSRERLEQLAQISQDWRGLVTLYETALSDSPELLIKTVGLTLAEVYRSELADQERAIEKYELVFRYDPADTTAVRALDALYLAQGSWSKLAEIIEQEIELAQNDDERVELYGRLGQLYEECLHLTSQAMEAYQAILRFDPQNQDAVNALYRMFINGHHRLEITLVLEPIFRERGDWVALNNVYEGRKDELTDRYDRIVALKQLAELNLHQLNDAAKALRWLGEAFRLDPLDEDAKTRMEALAEDTGRWNELVDIYTAVKEQVDDLDSKKVIWHRIARIQEERIGDLFGAEGTYIEIRMNDPEDLDALRALDRLFESQGRWQELVDVLEMEIRLIPYQDEEVTCIYRLGEIFQNQLGDVDNAIGRYKEIISKDPNHEPALEALSAIYRVHTDWQNLYNVLSSLVDVKESEDDRAAIMEEMAQIAEEMLSDPDEAIRLRNEILTIRGEERISLEALQGLYGRQERWSDYVEVSDRLAPHYDEAPAYKKQLFKNLGIVFREKLQRTPNAVDCWSRVLEIDAADIDALAALRVLHRETQDFERLVDVLERLIARYHEHPGVLKDLYTELGQIKTEVTLEPDQATEIWEKVLELDPQDLRAIISLERLYYDQERWDSCIEAIQRKVSLLQDNNQVVESLMLQANIFLERLYDPHQAIIAYEQVRDRAPGNLEASRLLEGLYREHGRWNDLRDLYLMRLEFIEDPQEKVDLCHQIGRLNEEELGSGDEAFVILEHALKIDPGSELTIQELERLAEVTGNWQGLVEVFDAAAQSVEAELRAELQVKIAHVYETRLQNDGYAVGYYRYVLERQPDHITALSALCRIYERIGHWQDLVLTFKATVRLLDNYDERIQMLYKLGDVAWHQLGELGEAIDAFKQVLSIDEFDETALKSLEQLYEANQNWIELIDVLHKQSSINVEEATGIKLQIAEIWENRVGSIDRAVEIYREIIHFEPSNYMALKALEGLYIKQENWRDLLDVYELLLDITHESDERSELYRQMAKIWEQEFHNKESAVDNYRRILEIIPTEETAILELERLFAELQRWEDLVETYGRHVEIVDDLGRKIQLYQAIGQVFSDQLSDLDRAIGSYQAALDLDPESMSTLEAMAKLYGSNYDWERCLESYDRMIRSTDDMQRRLEFYQIRGSIYEEHLVDAEKAEEQYLFALQLEPYYRPAIEALKALYTNREDWHKLIKTLKTEEQSTEDFTRKADVLYQIARTYEDHVNDLTNAIDYYEKTLEYVPGHTKAATPLVEMYLREKKWERAEPLLDMIVGRNQAADDHEKANLHYKLGVVAEHLLNEEKALQHYKMAHEAEPNHLDTLKGLARLNLSREYWDLASRNYKNILVSHRDSLSAEDLVEIYSNLGRISLKLGDRKKAINYLERVLEYDGQHENTLRVLIELYEMQGEWRRVVKFQHDLAEVKADPLERFAVLLEIGDLYRQKLRDNNAAVASFRDALDYKSDSKIVMLRLLEIFIETKDFTSALDTIERMTKVEDDPERLSNYYYTGAAIYRDEIRDEDKAVEFYNLALDADPGRLKAFEAIDRLCTRSKNWKALEQNYRRMLQRVLNDEGTHDLQFILFKALGELYRDRLHDLEKSVHSFRNCASLRPEDPAINEVLCQLHDVLAASDTEYLDPAVRVHRKMLTLKPGHTPSYKALNRLFLRLGDYDKAWCVCSVLTKLNHADENERNFYLQHRQNELPRFTQVLDHQRWYKYLFHPGLDRHLGNILMLITEAIHAGVAQAPDKQIAKKKNRIQLSDGRVFSNTFKDILQVLNLNAPEIYIKEGGDDLELHFTKPTCVYVGTELLRGRGQKELAFLIGNRLTYMRPEFYMVKTGKTFLTNALYAAIGMVLPDSDVPKNDDTELIRQHLLKLNNQTRERLTDAVKQMMASGTKLNISDWLVHIELTAIHSGLLVCNDYGVAFEMLKTRPNVGQLVRNLALYAISDHYFELRKQVGIDIKGA